MSRPASLALALCCMLGLAAGCSTASGSASSPDIKGDWDVTYDDTMRLELRVGGLVQRDELGEQGGQLSLRDAGAGLDIDIDCTRPDVVCPSEVWPRELTLAQAPGRIDDEGLQLSSVITGAGNGRCVSQPGSTIASEIVTVTHPEATRHEAVALTNGRIVTVFDATCFAPLAGLPAGAQVVLSTGFTAAKR